jgi:hypothetical protein
MDWGMYEVIVSVLALLFVIFVEWDRVIPRLVGKKINPVPELYGTSYSQSASSSKAEPQSKAETQSKDYGRMTTDAIIEATGLALIAAIGLAIVGIIGGVIGGIISEAIGGGVESQIVRAVDGTLAKTINTVFFDCRIFIEIWYAGFGAFIGKQEKGTFGAIIGAIGGTIGAVIAVSGIWILFWVAFETIDRSNSTMAIGTLMGVTQGIGVGTLIGGIGGAFSGAFGEKIDIKRDQRLILQFIVGTLFGTIGIAVGGFIGWLIGWLIGYNVTGWRRKLNVHWIKCGDVWCSLNSVNLQDSHFDGLEGIYIIWHGGNTPTTVRVGQGVIRDRLAAHRNDPKVQAYSNLGLYVTWISVAQPYRNGMEAFLAQSFKPLVGEHFPNRTPIEVNFPLS